MRKRLFIGFAVSCLAVMAAAGTATAGGGNSGAVQQCQQGGYLTMHRSDGSSFKNAGACVSYFAQGGAPGTSACSYVPGTSGCMTFDDVVVPADGGSGDTVTLNGAFSFSTTACLPGPFCSALPNAYATGDGTYSIEDSVGEVLESGTLSADGTAGTTEGLVETSFTDSGGTPASSCSTALDREVFVNVSTGNAGDPSLLLVGETSGGSVPSTSVAVDTATGTTFSNLASGLTLAC